MLDIQNSKGVIIINLHFIEDCKVQISNEQGSTITTLQLNQSVLTIDISNYKKGEYSIKFETENTTFSKPIIIE